MINKNNIGLKVGDKVRYRDSNIVGKVKAIYYSDFLKDWYVIVKVGWFKKYMWFRNCIEKVEAEKEVK